MAFTRAKRYTENTLLGVLALAPIFVLTVKGWTTLTLVLAAVLSLALLLLDRNSNLTQKQVPQDTTTKSNEKFWVWLMVITLASPVLAVLISQSLRQDWVWRSYDAPMRFLVAIPVFLYVYKRNLPVIKLWQWSFPLLVITTIVIMPFLPKVAWGVSLERVSTFFVDPLTFGHITLTFGLLSLFVVNQLKQENLLSNAIKILGLGVGIYLSLLSGSRTGWIAFPFALILWGLSRYENKNLLKTIVFGISFSLLSAFAIYQLSTTVRDRSSLAINEISHYTLNKENPYNSVGARLSMAREGFYFFKMSPCMGWGDEGYKEHINDPSITQFADPIVRNLPLEAGFHNEFITNAVHYGVWGIVSTALVFFVPLALFLKAYRRRINSQAALIGITYMICQLASAMSTEVWNLKFTAALSAVLIAGFCGVVLASFNQFNNRTVR